MFIFTMENSTDFEAVFSEIHKLMLSAKFIEAKFMLQSMNEEKIPDAYRYLYYNLLFETTFKTHNDETQFNESLKYLERAVEYTEDTDQKSTIYGNIAVYLIQKNRMVDAQSYVDKCFEFALSDSSKTFAYKIKGRILYLNNSLDESLECFTEAAHYAEITHNENMLFYITLEIAFVFEKMNRVNIAFSECDKAEQYARFLKDLNLFHRCAIYKAQLLYKLGRDEDAKKLINGIPKSLD